MRFLSYKHRLSAWRKIRCVLILSRVKQAKTSVESHRKNFKQKSRKETAGIPTVMPPAYLDQIPKVELHAHLNGCIRERTLFELAKERSVTLNDRHFATKPSQEASDHSMYNVRPRSLKDCFEMFAEIPKCVDDLSSLSRITKEALQDFAEHHVVYLELRSTPKQLFLHTSNDNLDELNLADKRQYCLTILNVMKDFEQLERKRFVKENSQNNDDCDPRLPMTCRLIIAVDRSKTLKEALEHIDLAVDLRKEFGDRIVGVDLGGNPTKVG